jgi:hypothetical protein
MKDGRPYTYTVLRYVHDVVTAEFVNVGVILHVPSTGLVDARVRSSMGRLRGVFPDLDREAFTRTMHAVARSIGRLAETKRNDLFASESDAAGLAGRALPRDDSSLQWSPVGAGLTNDPAKTLDRLFQRFVSRYDTRSAHRRTDDDVWRSVRQKLDERNLASLLQEKTIRGDVDEIVFRHAWKNGVWHVYEPLSFDLAEAEGIKTKAREWLGHLSAVADGTTERFKPHFIVGAPSRPELRNAYSSALAILQKAPVGPEIFEESQVDDLVAQIENEVRAHAVASPRETAPKPTIMS